MTNEKLTYTKAIESAIRGELTPEVVEKLQNLLISLEKRNASKAGKPTKAQIANAEIGKAIVEAMESGVVYTSQDITKLVPALEGATPQKVGPIMKKLAEAGSIVVDKVKGKNTYTLA